MCVAVPGRITEINGSMALVDFSGNSVSVNICLVDVKVGDYVLVHAGCALEVLQQDRAIEIIRLFKQLEEAWDDTTK